MKDKKIKVMTISDVPLSPSGVGNQTKYVIESLLESGKFSVVSLGGAVKHKSHKPIKTEEWGDDWVMYPVDGYGNPDIVRSLLRTERPDILYFMTDPRFYEWLWGIENEIRSLVPMVYYHVWDNYPYPSYNGKFYNSNDKVVSISKVTSDIVQTVSPDVEEEYLPHAVDPKFFKKVEDKDVAEFKKNVLKEKDKDKFVFFWNNRNARRKMPGSLIYWFKEFLDEVGEDKAMLIMHTDPMDQNGPNLESVVKELGVTDGQVLFSTKKVTPQELTMMYNMADCTINIADAEGFGLSSLESLSCGTPVINTMTGGLQEQVTDGKEWFGVGIEPSSKAIIGSQQVPFIYEDRIGKEDFISACKRMLEMSEEERNKMSELGMKHVNDNYNFGKFKERWVELMEEVYEKYGSWDTRKGYKRFEIREVI